MIFSMNMADVFNVLVGLVIILYVVLDGFILGIGILFPTAADEEERDMMMNAAAPVWDVNQTWIVFGGGALFAAFPRIYTILFPALYIPLLSFIFGLIFRGVAFEFRAQTTHKKPWNVAFFFGSLLATVNQGFVLGGFISGVRMESGAFSGGPLDWFSPFTLMVGAALVFGYMLLGSCYLIMKTTGPVQDRAYVIARFAALAVVFFLLLVTVWTPHHAPELTARWWMKPRIYFVWNFPLLGAAALYLLLRGLKQRREIMPFAAAILLFVSAYLGLQAALWPLAIPPDLSIYDAASQPATMKFTLWGIFLVLPVILSYTIYSYWVFRGKVGAAESYH